MAKSPDSTSTKTSSGGAASGPSPEGPLWVLERRTHKVISRHRFAARMGLAILLWGALTVIGLAIGMAGYAHFESMSWTDAYVNAAMILSGMGPVGDLKTQAGKDLRRLLCDLLRPHHRHCHRLHPCAGLPSCAA